MPPRKPPLQNSETSLVITLVEGPCEGQVFFLDTFPLTVGRKRTNKVFIKDNFVSEQHAQLYCADGHWYIKELGSSNGTVINKQKFSSEDAPRQLQPGDEIKFGNESVALIELDPDTATVEQWLVVTGVKRGLQHKSARQEALEALEGELAGLVSQHGFACEDSLLAAQQRRPDAFPPTSNDSPSAAAP